MDFTIYTARPERSCRACTWDTWLEQGDPPPHVCRARPAVPQSTLQDHARAARAVFARKELAIREGRMAEITMSRIRRGRI